MTDWYVSPTGSSGNAGTIGSPWDLTSALTGHSGSIKAGDTVWLRGGDYDLTDPNLTCSVSGVVGVGVDDVDGKVIFRAYNPTVAGTNRKDWFSNGKATDICTGDPSQTERFRLRATQSTAAPTSGATTVNGAHSQGATTISIAKAAGVDQAVSATPAQGIGHQLQIGSNRYLIAASATIVQGANTNVTIASPGLATALSGGEAITLILNHSNVDTLTITGSFVWFWDWEMLQIVKARTTPGYAGACFSTFGATNDGVKFINNLVDYAGTCFFIERTSGAIEGYGNITINEGGNGTNDGLGHDWYIHHDDAVKQARFQANCQINSYSLHMQMYDAGGGPVDNVLWRNNITVNAGQLCSSPNIGGVDADMYVVGGGTVGSVSYLLCNENFGFIPEGKGSRAFNASEGGGISGEGNQILRNYMHISGMGFGAIYCGSFVTPGALKHRDNVYVVKAPSGGVGNGRCVEIQTNGGAQFDWGHNLYYRGLGNSGGCGAEVGSPTAFKDAAGACRTVAQFNADCAFLDDVRLADPSVAHTFVVPADKYQAGRGYALYYNYPSLSTIPIDLSALLKRGDRFVAHDIRDTLAGMRGVGGSPVIGPTTYAGGTVDFPTTQVSDPVPNGSLQGVGQEVAAPATAPRFNVFLIQRISPAAVTHETERPVLAAAVLDGWGE